MRRSALWVLVLAGLAAAQTPTPSELVERHIKAVDSDGSGTRSLVRKGVIKQAEGEYPAKLQAVTPDGWRLVLEIPGVLVEVVNNGKESWEQTPGGTEATSPAFFAQLDPAFSLGFLLNPGPRLTGMRVKERRASGERDVWAAEVDGPEGKVIPVHFDAATGLLVRYGASVLEDYRRVGGLMAPHRVGVAEGRMAFLFQAREAEVNAPVEPAHFVKESNTAAYRAAQRAANAAALEKWGHGVDWGAAREVLLNMGDFSPEDGRILYDVITSKGYQRGLEIGTARGNSAIWMGLAFRKTGGRLITLEINETRARIAQENFRKAGLETVVECRVNDAFKEIPRLEGTFDFVFMDTGAALHQKFLDLLYARIVPGGAVSSHNANDLERMEPAFWKTITTDPNLETKITRTPSGGVSVSVKKR